MKNIIMRFPGNKKKALTLSYDDGVVFDKKLIEILDRYGIKCTFNINSGLFGTGRRLSESEAYEIYSGTSHEIAVHSLSHPDLTALSPERISYEITEDRKNLEKLFGKIIKGMAYPYGTYNNNVTDVLKSSGIVYSRTTQTTGGFRIPENWLELPATCHHNDKNLMKYAEKFVNESPEKYSWLFYLWGHSYEFNDNDNWEVIEKFAEYMGKKEDIWYAANIEIYDYINAYNRLIFSYDGTLVTNPSAIDVYLEVDGNVVIARAGESNLIL